MFTSFTRTFCSVGATLTGRLCKGGWRFFGGFYRGLLDWQPVSLNTTSHGSGDVTRGGPSNTWKSAPRFDNAVSRPCLFTWSRGLGFSGVTLEAEDGGKVATNMNKIEETSKEQKLDIQ